MTTTLKPTRNLARPSRDGDHFHYLWAARRCLRLLSSHENLVSITIEGPSPHERPQKPTVPPSEEVIDIAEYFGDEELSGASLVRYMQLKHSTLRKSTPWTVSGLSKTLRDFSSLYQLLSQEFTSDELAKRFEFWFVTNRPISSILTETVIDAAHDTTTRHPNELNKLEIVTAMRGANLSSFCRLIHFEDGQDDYWDQRNLLFQEVTGYLPESDTQAPTQLKELVTRKALSESEANPSITKIDVLRALNTDEDALYPAPCLITPIENAIPRKQESDIVQAIVEAEHQPIIIHALAGVGKSILSTTLPTTLPSGSVSILYDCFGNGQYRNPTEYRHRHRDALVQIANELAAKCLCHPLIPTIHSDASSYLRAFIYRLDQAIQQLLLANPHAILCIVIDAADNAQLIADESGYSRSFARDLLRVPLPDHVRLVVFCRTHRQHILDPPPHALRIELEPFTVAETAAHLHQIFPNASDDDVTEFHRLTSRNPRLQAYALSQSISLAETLRRLGPQPRTVEGKIGHLLNDAIKRLQYEVGPIEAEQIANFCTGLAVLPPLIPVDILSTISQVSREAIRSIVFDLARPLLLSDDTIQFRDEPVETWFREHFQPPHQQMVEFLENLSPLAQESSYVASVLPQMMLNAGQYSELVQLALTSAALPDTNELEKNNISLQRLQLALKASLRLGRYCDAVKLALKAGGETAGKDRLHRLIQDNTDLSSLFLDKTDVQNVISGRIFKSSWCGSHYAYEAALFSGHSGLRGEARSRLRMAYEWLNNWSKLTTKERNSENISCEDIAEFGLAELNIYGADATVRHIRRWRSTQAWYRVGRILSRRLIDQGRLTELNTLATASGETLYLVLAIIVELRSVHRTPPSDVVRRSFRLVSHSGVNLSNFTGSDSKETALHTVTSLVEAALKLSLCSYNDAATLLSHYLPSSPRHILSSRFPQSCSVLLRAYCLCAALRDQTLQLSDLVPSDLKAELAKEPSYAASREMRVFESEIGALLPWYRLRAEACLGKIRSDMIPEALTRTRESSQKAAQLVYVDHCNSANQIALLWFEILNVMETIDEDFINVWKSWMENLDRPLFTPTLTALARQCAQRAETKPIALYFALRAFNLTRSERTDAESKSKVYIEISRSILAIKRLEAEAYFNEAVAIANKIGDENLSRWDAILDLADCAAWNDECAPETAYQFARCAELTYQYVVRDKYFDWTGTVKALSSLSPKSAIAILSRWCDRRFGRMERLLPVVMHTLIEHNCVDPRDVLALVGFEAEWDYVKILSSVLDRCNSRSEKEAASELIFRYMKCNDQTITVWNGVKSIVIRHGISLDDIDSYIEFARQRDQVINRGWAKASEEMRVEEEEGTQCSWDEIFSEVDLTTTDGVMQGYLAFRDKRSSHNDSSFFAEAFRRAPAGDEATLVRVTGEIPQFDLHHLRWILESIPDAWKRRPAIEQSLRATLNLVFQRCWMKVSKNRHFEVFPFNLACTLTGMKEEDIFQVVLDSIAKSPELLDSNRLFTLVGLLKSKIKYDEAFDALNFGLSLFDPLLDDSDGDGPWSIDLAPPDSTRASIAGYIYGALAAPRTKRRWEAAHAVLGLSALGRTETLRDLIAFSKTGAGGPFVDARLPFYKLHALQWLVIAFARAAIEYPTTLLDFCSDLIDVAFQAQSHVLIRQFAARSVATLIESGEFPVENGMIERLSHVNIAPYSGTAVRSFEDVGHELSDPRQTDDGDKFYFGVDIGPYWYKPLGRVFSLSQSEIEIEALKVIRNEFCYFGTGAWSEDERARRGIHRPAETRSSHGAYPDAHNHHTYLCYHAMMIVAGRLLLAAPIRHDTETNVEDEFAQWLARHELSRNDGRWLADRRDPMPLEWLKWRYQKEGHIAHNSPDHTHFKQALGTASVLNVWGYWSIVGSISVQLVQVRSAFVCSDRSMALLRALSADEEGHIYSIPRSSGQCEIDQSGFKLKGWIEDCGDNRQLDNKDPWSGGVQYPPPIPSVDTIDLMALKTDVDMRRWRDSANQCVMASQVWGHLEVSEQSDHYSHGRRLEASMGFVNELLKEIDRDLIVGVRIETRQRNWRYGRKRDDGEQRQTGTQIYVVRSNGEVATLRGGPIVGP